MVLQQRATDVQAQQASVPLVAAGRREFRCAGCGYGARCKTARERCPMCSGSAWTYVASGACSDEGDIDSNASLSRDD
jgi:rubrerythrin